VLGGYLFVILIVVKVMLEIFFCCDSRLDVAAWKHRYDCFSTDIDILGKDSLEDKLEAESVFWVLKNHYR
jgi:hypothetical protein